jgi:tetratricopeptide (TPR) repeat protein
VEAAQRDSTEAARAAAFERLSPSPETTGEAIDVRFELRTALQILRAADRQKACLADALRLAEAHGDQKRLGYALMFSALRAVLDDRLPEGMSLGQRALAIGQATGDPGISSGSRCYLAIACLFRGDFAATARLSEEAVAAIPPERMGERFGQARIVSNLAHSLRAFALARLGRFADAETHIEAALEIARDADNQYCISSSSYELGLIQLLKGEHDDAARTFERANHIWRALQVPIQSALEWLGLAYCRAGRVTEGLALISRDDDWSAATFYWDPYLVRAEAHLLAGNLAQATAQARHALDGSRNKGQRAFEAEALYLIGDVASRADPPDDAAARRAYEDARGLAHELGMRPLVARCHLDLGALERHAGRTGSAREHLTRAASMLREMDMRFWGNRAETELTEIR